MLGGRPREAPCAAQPILRSVGGCANTPDRTVEPDKRRNCAPAVPAGVAKPASLYIIRQLHFYYQGSISVKSPPARPCSPRRLPCRLSGNSLPARGDATRNRRYFNGLAPISEPPAKFPAIREFPRCWHSRRCGGNNAVPFRGHCRATREDRGDMKNDDRPRSYRHDTLLTHLGRNPEAQHGVVNPPVYHASTILSKDVAEWEGRRAAPPFGVVRYGLHGTPGRFRWKSCSRASRAAIARCWCRRDWRRLPRRCRRCSAPATIADGQFLLRAGAQLLRRHPEQIRGRDDLLRPADRRGHRRADAAKHQGRLCRSRRAP